MCSLTLTPEVLHIHFYTYWTPTENYISATIQDMQQPISDSETETAKG